MTASRTRTQANGIDLDNWSHIESEAARRFAAACPRGGHEAIDHIETDPGGRVCVWLSFDVDEIDTVPIPDGFRATTIGTLDSGAAFVQLEREAEG